MQSLRNCLSAFKFIGSSLGSVGQSQFGSNVKPALVALQCQQRNLSTLTSRISPSLTISAVPSSTPISALAANSSLLQPTSTSSFASIVRTTTRNHFPKPSEVKRIRRHGLKYRLKTKGGREIIFKRILKGRHCLAHGW